MDLVQQEFVRASWHLFTNHIASAACSSEGALKRRYMRTPSFTQKQVHEVEQKESSNPNA